MRGFAAFLVAAALAGGAGSQPAPPAPPEPHVHAGHVVVTPDWVRQPSPDEMQAFYPRFALYSNVAGLAHLNCAVDLDGHASDCHILDETPERMGFGAAAMKLSPRFLFRPATIDGKPVGGARVIIPVRFAIAPDAPAGPSWLDRLLHRSPQAATPSPSP